MTVSVKFSPWGNQQFVDESGNPAVGWYIETYAAGSSTRQATYTDATGTTAQTADIVLNALGLPTSGQIWLISGSPYKFKLYNAAGVLKDTVDNVSGVNDSSETTDQWVASGLTPTYINATTFTLVGDQTTDFHVGRRLQFTVTAGTVYGTIATSVYGTLTTVTVSLDSGSLDSGLSAINLSILRNDHLATPGGIAKSGANSDITSLSGLTTPLSVAQGGTGSATELGLHFGSIAAAPSTTTWTRATAAGKFIYTTAAGATTQTLPLASTFSSGQAIAFFNNGAGTPTFTRQGTDGMLGLAVAGTSFVLNTNESVILTTDGSSWFCNFLNGATGLAVRTIQNLTASRASGTTYTNSTGRDISVSLTASMSSGSAYAILTVDGIAINGSQTQALANNRSFVSATIPNGKAYALTASGGTATVDAWAEYR